MRVHVCQPIAGKAGVCSIVCLKTAEGFDTDSYGTDFDNWGTSGKRTSMSVVGILKGLGEAGDRGLEVPTLLRSRAFCRPAKRMQDVRRNLRAACAIFSKVG